VSLSKEWQFYYSRLALANLAAQFEKVPIMFASRRTELSASLALGPAESVFPAA